MNLTFAISKLVVVSGVLAWNLSACTDDAGTDTDVGAPFDGGPTTDAADLDAIENAPVELSPELPKLVAAIRALIENGP